MNAISGLRRNALDVMVQRLAVELTEELSKHRLDNFPPAAAKEFRRITATEATRFLGVTDSYLRQIAAELFGPTEPGQTRRSYTLHDLDVLRRAMADRSRSPGKFVPARREGERLQSIAVVNFKGGSAKTTTAANLSQYLALYGYRVLAIDLDPQASLTTVFGIAPETGVRDNESLYGAIRYDGERVSPETIIRETYIPGLSVIPGALELMEFEHETPRALLSSPGSSALFLNRVADVLAAVEGRFDVVIMDCPPQLGYLTMSALIASTSVLVTVHPQMLDVASMAQFLTMLGALLSAVSQAAGGERLEFDWLRFLITRFEPTDGPQAQMANFLRRQFGDLVLTNPTLKSTAISDAGLTNQTIYEVERGQFTRSTYDRALDSVNGVNAEITGLMRSAWGRA
jgi:chromosome partitioning protein